MRRQVLSSICRYRRGNSPQQAKDAGKEGEVFVEFYTEKDGSVPDANVLQGIGYGSCDNLPKQFLFHFVSKKALPLQPQK